MNLKYYLRGVGVGLVVATLILSIAYSNKNTSDSASNNKLQGESQKDYVSNIRESQTPKQSEAQTQSEIQSETQTQTQTEKPTEKETQTETQTQPQTEAETQPVVNTIEVTLSNVTSSEQVSEILQSAGVVENWMDFNYYLIVNDYSRSIKNGTYVFDDDDDYESIAKKITN